MLDVRAQQQTRCMQASDGGQANTDMHDAALEQSVLHLQGFEPGACDAVFATNVLHATCNMAATLQQCKALLRTGGLLLVNELCVRTDFLTLTFGLTNGWWLFDDAELRIPGSPLLSRYAKPLKCSLMFQLCIHGIRTADLLCEGWTCRACCTAYAGQFCMCAVDAELPAPLCVTSKRHAEQAPHSQFSWCAAGKAGRRCCQHRALRRWWLLARLPLRRACSAGRLLLWESAMA